MPKLFKLLHHSANTMQALRGHLEIIELKIAEILQIKADSPERDRAIRDVKRHVAEAIKLSSDMFTDLRQLSKHIE